MNMFMIVWIRYKDGMEKGYTAYVRNSLDLKEKLDRLNIRTDNLISLIMNIKGTIRAVDPDKLNEL